MPEATLESIAKDLRKVLLDFDSLRREVRDNTKSLDSVNAELKAAKAEIEKLKGGA